MGAPLPFRIVPPRPSPPLPRFEGAWTAEERAQVEPLAGELGGRWLLHRMEAAGRVRYVASCPGRRVVTARSAVELRARLEALRRAESGRVRSS